MKEQIADILKNQIIDEWVLAGHSLSGSFEESLEAEFVDTTRGYIINIWGNEYGIYRSKGVPAENIPYTRRKRGQGRGGKSKYLTGLINYVQMRMGIGDYNEAVGVAFAIAEKHKQYGMLGSGFLDEVKEKVEEKITEEISKGLDIQINSILDEK